MITNEQIDQNDFQSSELEQEEIVDAETIEESEEIGDEKKGITHLMIMKALDFGYEKAINGLPGFDSAEEMANNYMSNGSNHLSNANSLIRWQITKASTSGFLTGLGGLITMPFTIPANISSVLYIQIRMIAAIAIIGGYDLKDDRVKTLVYACMAGNGIKDIFKNTGIVIGRKMTASMIKNISAKTLTKINRKVGFRLLTKFGSTGAINMGKAIPFMGGIIGGTLDGVTTTAIGKIAIKTFLPDEPNERQK